MTTERVVDTIDMIEYLSDILNGGVSHRPDDPCFVIRYHHDNNSSCNSEDDDDDDNNNGRGDETKNDNDNHHHSTIVHRRLSYRQAQDALLQHQCWLAALEEEQGIPVKASSSTSTIVAYLSSNSIDYILSVMACSSPITEKKRCNNATQKQDQQQQQQHHLRSRRLLPALLNTRWTANEAVSALMNRKHNNNNTTTNILLLYGPGFEVMANNIVIQLNNNNNVITAANTKTPTFCCRCCLPIPNFAMEKILAGPPQMLVKQQQQQQQDSNTAEASCTVVKGPCRRPFIDPEREIRCLEDAYYKRRYSRRRPNNNNKNDRDDDDDDDTALIVFTSGTTSSVSKGVKLGHLAILIQSMAKLTTPCQYSIDTVMLASPSTTVPFFHVGGLTSLLAVWLAGGTLLQVQLVNEQTTTMTMTNGSSFDPVVVLQSLQPASMMMTSSTIRSNTGGRLEEPATTSFSSSSTSSSYYCSTLVLVPAMLHALQQQQRQQQQQQQLSSNTQRRHHVVIYPFVKLVLIGGQSASSRLLDFARQHFPNARLVQTYACTEAASSITFCDVTTTRKQPPAATAPPPPIIIMSPSVKTTTTTLSSTPSMMPATINEENYLSSGDCVGQPPRHIKVALVRIPPPLQKQHDDSSNATSRNQQAMMAQPKKIISNISMICEPWQVGVIATRGPHVMNGYWDNNSDNNNNDCNHDDWFITNDLGFWGPSDKNDNDNNNNDASKQFDLYFCGRTTDTIRTGGETVLALEVERILLQHPSIDQVTVFDVPDEQYGQAVVCAIVLAENDDGNNINKTNPLLSLDHVRQWCKQHGLAGYKCPRQVFCLTELPRNSSGKVLKMRLRERFGQFSSRSKL